MIEDKGENEKKRLLLQEHLQTRRKSMKTNKTFIKPVIDLQGTGSQIRRLRKICGYTVRDLQMIFGFEYPQAIYAWEQGKSIPSIDNLLVLSELFGAPISEIVVSSKIEKSA